MKLKGHKYNFVFISSFKMKPTKIGFKYLYPILCHNKGSTNSDGGNYNNDDNNK